MYIKCIFILFFSKTARPFITSFGLFVKKVTEHIHYTNGGYIVMQNDPDGNQDSGVYLTDEEAAFNFHLNDMDRLGNIIGAMGVALVFNATDEVEEILLREQAQNISVTVDAQMNYEVASKLATVNWIYVIAIMFFLYTSSERLAQLHETLDMSLESSRERVRGREMVTIGDMFKILGYTLTAQGFDLIADSTLREQQETPPP